MDFAVRTRQILFIAGVSAIAYGKEKVPLAIKEQARAEAHAAATIQGIVGFEDLLLLDECPVAQLAAEDSSKSQSVRALIAIGEVNPITIRLRVVRRQRHVQQSSLATEDGGRSTHRLRQQPAILDDAQAARALGDQHTTVGKKRNCPRLLQPIG